MGKVLFIHRSVGENLIKDGNVYGLLEARTDIEFSDFNQNTGILRSHICTKQTDMKMPSDNTHPKDYAELFSKEYTSKLKDFVMGFDTIVIKSCYPNSNIKSSEELESIKQYYCSITDYFSKISDKNLIILSSPPLTPYMTKRINALRARELSDWLSTEKFGSNVTVLNLFDLLAEKNGYRANMLKRNFRRLIPFDSHPNQKASAQIAPVFVNLIANTR